MVSQKTRELTILLSNQKKTTRNLVTNKEGTHMISFPMYWFRKWNNRFVSIEAKNDAIFVYSTTEEESTSKLRKIGPTHYIKLDNSAIESLDYPETFEMRYYCNYIEITVPEFEKQRIKNDKVQIELRKRNERMKQKYSKMI